MSHCLDFPPALPEHLDLVDETEARRADYLDNCMLSQGIDWAQLQTIAKFWLVCEAPAEQVIIAERSTIPLMGVVISGVMRAEKVDSSGEHRELARFGKGRIFGEMAMLDNEPASASVVAASDARLLLLSVCAMEQLCEEYPGAALSMIKTIARQISQKLRHTSGRLVDLM